MGDLISRKLWLWNYFDYSLKDLFFFKQKYSKFSLSLRHHDYIGTD